MEKPPKISIITPSLNQGQFLERTILSVLNQDYPDIEYIVMDGGSTDNSLEILKKYHNRVIWKSEPDKGQAHALNKGIKIATGEIIGWLNSDDMYRPNAFKNTADFFLKHVEIGMVYGKCNIIDENDNHICFYKTEAFNFERYINDADIIPQQSAFIKKQIIEKVGYLDQNLKYAMDLDLFVRIAKKYNLKYLPTHLASFRRHKGQKSSSGDEKIYKDYYLEINNIVGRQGANRFNRRLIDQKLQIIRRYTLKKFFPMDTIRYQSLKRLKDLIRHDR